MNDSTSRTIELREYQAVTLTEADLSSELGEAVWRRWSKKVEVEFPSPKTDQKWQLRSLGWVGHIPVSEDLTLYLSPKVPLENLFRLLEYAYSLDIHFPDGLTRCDSLTEFYERLANILASRAMERGRRGLYRAYLGRCESLPYLRGRLDVRAGIRRPWDPSLTCRYDEQTSDVEENQILFWTLSCIAHSRMCSDRVLPAIRRAYRLLQGAASLRPFDATACVGRLYNRLNDDYEGMHGLCRFFLEHTGPEHRVGERTMLPFLIDMARLFELFVARWLESHLPEELAARAQERVVIGECQELTFDIDLVVFHRATGRTLCVLDTKYKADPSPSNHDVNQVATYALAKDTRHAFLIYPQAAGRSFNAVIGQPGIRVRTLAFPLDGDIDEAGADFLAQLLAALGSWNEPVS